MTKPLLLVIDDEPLILDCLRYAFPAREVEMVTAQTAADGVAAFESRRPDAVILDLRLPDSSGLEVQQRLQSVDAKVPIILVTGHGSATTAIEAMRQGAYDYLVKPLDLETLTKVVDRAFAVRRLMGVPVVLPDQDDDGASEVLLGGSPPMQEVYKAIGRIASQDVTVLILGESGTGKEMVARALYQHSKRSRGPFLAINCAAIPEQLLESELFGHERGAFTGADRRRIGKFEQCHGGTLFLDEVGDMAPLTQAKILRVLQDRQFERLGGNETVFADVRVIAATNRDLEEAIAAGRFRQDLYYRLNDFVIKLPPLRERTGDLELLVGHFLRRFNREFDRGVQGVSAEALERLAGYPWPGNVRELQSVVRQAMVHCTGPILGLEDLPELGASRSREPSFAAARQGDWPELSAFVRQRLGAGSENLLPEVLEIVERQVVRDVLHHAHHNISRSARILGITRPTLRSKLAALGIDASASPHETASMTPTGERPRPS